MRESEEGRDTDREAKRESLGAGDYERTEHGVWVMALVCGLRKQGIGALESAL